MINFMRRDHQIMSNARLRAISSAVKMLAWLVIRKLFTTSPVVLWQQVQILACNQ